MKTKPNQFKPVQTSSAQQTSSNQTSSAHPVNFVSEHELSFYITKKSLGQLITQPTTTGLPILYPTESIRITQKWVQSSKQDDIIIKSRIRKTEHIKPMALTEYSYDTKYYLASKSDEHFNITNRIELNAPLTEEEYNIISDIHSNVEPIEKTRLVLQNSVTHLIYTADIYDRKELINIEIEFDTEKEMNAFIKPQWLIDNEVKV